MIILNKTLKVTVVLSIFVFILSTAFPPILVAQPTYTISGRVTDSSSGSGIDGVTITFIGTASGTETTASGGYYSHTVALGWVGTVTPSLLPYTFTPVSAPIGPVTGNVTQDFTAVQPGTIIVKKQTEPPGGEGFSFTYDFDGSGTFTINDGWTETIPNVPPGTYTITETVPANWDLTDFQCETDDTGDTSGLNGNVATIDLDAGETITCTFTNSEWGTIALHKVTDPPDGVTFSFASDIFGAWSFTLDHCTTLSFTIPAATYTVTETLPFGWSLSNFDCETDDESDTSSLSGNQLTVDLDPGETITCTLTNSGWGTIFLHKVTDPPGGAGFDFLSDFDFLRPPEFPLDPDFSLGHCTTLSFTIPAATYTITETLPVDWYLAGFDCETDDPNDTSTWQGSVVSIDLDVAETITCTINNSQYGSIVLRKRTVPPGGTGFELANPFGIGPPSFSINDGDTLTIPYVPAGTFSVTEADPIPAGFQLIDVYCEDPDGGSSVDLETGTATIDLDAGETVACTFINGQYILTTDTDGEGTGTVTSEPTGINCGADCTENYAPDTVVTLTAYPGVKSYFIEWRGDCTGTDPTTTVTMDADKLCTATFGYPIGGIAVPVDRLGLVAPWMGLVTLAGIVALGVAMVRRRRGV